MKKQLLIVLCLFASCFPLGACHRNEPSTSADGGYDKIPVKEANIESETHSISDFTKIKIGMTYAEVVKAMGEPTGSQGFGFVWQTYELSDGSYVKLLFGSEDELVSMCIVDPDDRIFELQQD